MGRVLTFSDDRVQKLMGDFVPLAMERTEHATKTRFFRQVVNQKPLLERGEWGIEAFDAAQGCYIFDSAGRLFAKGNIHADHIVDMMRSSLRRMRQKSDPARLPPGRDPGSRSPVLPAGTLVARVHGRIAPLPKNASPLVGVVGRDVLWILRREVKALVGGKFPEALRNRLVLGHLRDFVRGEPGRWEPEDMKKADFRAVPSRSGGVIRVALSGSFRTSAPVRDGHDEYWNVPSGYEGTIEGELVLDARTEKVTRFLLYAEGMAWGEVEFTPGAPEGKFPLKIGFHLADDGETVKTWPYGAGSSVHGPYLAEGYPER